MVRASDPCHSLLHQRYKPWLALRLLGALLCASFSWDRPNPVWQILLPAHVVAYFLHILHSWAFTVKALRPKQSGSCHTSHEPPCQRSCDLSTWADAILQAVCSALCAARAWGASIAGLAPNSWRCSPTGR